MFQNNAENLNAPFELSFQRLNADHHHHNIIMSYSFAFSLCIVEIRMTQLYLEHSRNGEKAKDDCIKEIHLHFHV